MGRASRAGRTEMAHTGDTGCCTAAVSCSGTTESSSPSNQQQYLACCRRWGWVRGCEKKADSSPAGGAGFETGHPWPKADQAICPPRPGPIPLLRRRVASCGSNQPCSQQLQALARHGAAGVELPRVRRVAAMRRRCKSRTCRGSSRRLCGSRPGVRGASFASEDLGPVQQSP
jgi:hypothetical protein